MEKMESRMGRMRNMGYLVLKILHPSHPCAGHRHQGLNSSRKNAASEALCQGIAFLSVTKGPVLSAAEEPALSVAEGEKNSAFRFRHLLLLAEQNAEVLRSSLYRHRRFRQLFRWTHGY